MHLSDSNAAPGDNLVLIGQMWSGKSSAARELARLTSRRWVDTDKLAAQAAGRTIPEIFAEHGEEHFRELETAALRSLRDERRLIIATGGGIVTRPDNPALLRALGCVILLSAAPDVLFARVSRNQQRPLLQTANPRATLDEILARRQADYIACAHVIVDTTTGAHAVVAERILAGAKQFFAKQEALRR